MRNWGRTRIASGGARRQGADMDTNTTSPFHRSFLLRATTCIALMTLVFVAGRLMIKDSQGPETVTDEALAFDTPPRPSPTQPQADLDEPEPFDVPSSTDTELLDIDELAEPFEDLAEEALGDTPGGEAPEPLAETGGGSTFAPLSGPLKALRLTVPEQWKTVQEPGAEVALLAAPDRGDGLPVEVLVTRQNLKGQTLGEVASVGRAALAAGLDNFEEQEYGETTLAGRKAYRLHATYLAGDGTGREVETWWMADDDGGLYVLNASRSGAGDENDWGDARAMIASVTLGPA